LHDRHFNAASSFSERRVSRPADGIERQGIAVYGAFFITMFARPSFGGSLYDHNAYLPFKPPGPEKWRWDVNVTAFTVLVVVLLAGLATI
jgi:hypothetical protein